MSAQQTTAAAPAATSVIARTPGPWIANHGWQIEGAPHPAYPEWCEVTGPEKTNGYRLSISGHFGIANARLIAAAPNMLAALHEALEFAVDQEEAIDGDEGEQLPNRAMVLAQTLRVAIAKAEGAA